MHNQLITTLPITSQVIGGDETNAVCARRLHQELDIGQMYAHWIKAQIERGGFVENIDYGVFAEFSKNPQGGRPSMEYMLSLDMAKHVCMMSQTEKGKLIRKYFIECEKRLSKITAAGARAEYERLINAPRSELFLEMAKMAEENETLYAENKELAHKVDTLAPKAEALDRISDRKSVV